MLRDTRACNTQRVLEAAQRVLSILILCVQLAATDTKISQDDNWRGSDQPLENLKGSCPIKRVHASELELKQVPLDEPIIISGLGKDWPAHQRWKKKQFLKLYGKIMTNVSSSALLGTFGLEMFRETMSMREYVQQWKRPGDEIEDQPLVFDDYLIRNNADFRKDFETPKQVHHIHNTKEKNWNMLSVGADRAGTLFHVHGATWLMVLYGAKRWFILPPGAHHKSLVSAQHISVEYWAKHVYPRLKPSQRPIECVQKEGELFFLPSTWVHATMNVGETIGVGGQQFSSVWNYNRSQNCKDDFFCHASYQKLPDPKVKLEHLKAAIKINPFAFNLWEAVIKTNFDKGDAEQAIKHVNQLTKFLEKAQEARSASKKVIAVAWLNLGTIFRKYRKPAQAIPCFDKAEQIWKEIPPFGLAMQRAMAYLTGGKLTEALRHAQICLKYQPKNKALLDMIQKIHENRHQEV